MKLRDTPLYSRQDGAARQRLERWRSTRAHRSPIPEHLWTRAVELARQHGICATARTLRLDYTRLKTRLESTHHTSGVNSKRTFRRAESPALMEMIGPGPGYFPQGVVELEGPRGG